MGHRDRWTERAVQQLGQARTWTFWVDGDPVPWARPRKRRGGGYYEKPEVTIWRRVVASYALLVKPTEPTTAALEVVLIFRLRRPSYLPKAVRYHTKKPDLDNFVKGIQDSLNGLIYHDDAQIIRALTQKDYAHPGETPGVLIRITEILSREEA